MTGADTRARTRRVLALAGLGLALIGVAPILAAPSVPATCATILTMIEGAGEPVGAPEREACEQHYGQLRASRGLLRWTWLSWCTWAAGSIPEAGEC